MRYSIVLFTRVSIQAQAETGGGWVRERLEVKSEKAASAILCSSRQHVWICHLVCFRTSPAAVWRQQRLS